MRLVFFIALLFIVAPLYGQQMSDEYERIFGEEEAFYEIEQHTSTESEEQSLFLPARSDISIFDRLARRNFNFIYYDNRGYDDVFVRHYLCDLDISSGMDKYPNYLLFNILGPTVPRLEEYSDAGNDIPAGAMGAVVYRIWPSEARRGVWVRADYSEQLFRGAGRIAAAGELGGGWSAMFNARYRAGRDKFIGGLFTESAVAGASAEKDFGRGKLAFMALGGVSERGMRLWAVKETYALTGDNLYNPSWGLYAGKERNSQVRNDRDLLLVANYSTRSDAKTLQNIHYDTDKKTEISLSVIYRRSERNRSSLAWQSGAPNPMPDHYTKLPSYFSDPDTSSILTDIWRSDESVHHIDWACITDANRYGGGASYILDGRVGTTDSFQAAFSASTHMSNSFTLGYGARLSVEGNSFYRIADDMLGGDYFLYDRGIFGETDNDVKDMEKIVEGKRFDYDFTVPRFAAELFATGKLTSGSWSAGFDATMRGVVIYRTERLEQQHRSNDYPTKEPASDTYRMPLYDAKLYGRYALSPRSLIAATLWAAARETPYQDIFLDARYSNSLSSGLSTPMFASGAEISFKGELSPTVEAEAAAYHTLITHGTANLRYWDDVRREAVVMQVGDIERSYTGIQAALSLDITERLSGAASVSLGRYVYASDASSSVYRAGDLEPLSVGESIHIEGLACTPSPQTLFAISARYAVARSWNFEATMVYAADRYVSINPTRRSDSVLEAALSPETRADFISQEGLPPALVLNINIGGRFRLFGHDVYASVSVNNLLGRKDMIYGGYEQMRLRNSGGATNRSIAPLPSRFAYCYPRTIYASLSITL